MPRPPELSRNGRNVGPDSCVAENVSFCVMYWARSCRVAWRIAHTFMPAARPTRAETAATKASFTTFRRSTPASRYVPTASTFAGHHDDGRRLRPTVGNRGWLPQSSPPPLMLLAAETRDGPVATPADWRDMGGGRQRPLRRSLAARSPSARGSTPALAAKLSS